MVVTGPVRDVHVGVSLVNCLDSDENISFAYTEICTLVVLLCITCTVINLFSQGRKIRKNKPPQKCQYRHTLHCSSFVHSCSRRKNYGMMKKKKPRKNI